MHAELKDLIEKYTARGVTAIDLQVRSPATGKGIEYPVRIYAREVRRDGGWRQPWADLVLINGEETVPLWNLEKALQEVYASIAGENVACTIEGEVPSFSPVFALNAVGDHLPDGYRSALRYIERKRHS